MRITKQERKALVYCLKCKRIVLHQMIRADTYRCFNGHQRKLGTSYVPEKDKKFKLELPSYSEIERSSKTDNKWRMFSVR